MVSGLWEAMERICLCKEISVGLKDYHRITQRLLKINMTALEDWFLCGFYPPDIDYEYSAAGTNEKFV